MNYLDTKTDAELAYLRANAECAEARRHRDPETLRHREAAMERAWDAWQLDEAQRHYDSVVNYWNGQTVSERTLFCASNHLPTSAARNTWHNNTQSDRDTLYPALLRIYKVKRRKWTERHQRRRQRKTRRTAPQNKSAFF